MFPKIKKVIPLAGYILFIVFENGEEKQYAIQTACKKWNIFENLLIIPHLFEQVKLDQGGYGIIWNDEIDLSANELYQNGVKINKERNDMIAHIS